MLSILSQFFPNFIHQIQQKKTDDLEENLLGFFLVDEIKRSAE
jgi:hypothetical protein